MIHRFVLANRKHLLGFNSFLQLLSLATATLILAGAAQAQVCATPGKDGSPGTITGVVNTYYPGAADVAAGGSSITLGAATGAATQITAGDLLLVIQMQDASINSSNTGNYGNNTAGDPGSGYISANGVGRYEFVRALNTVPLAGGAALIFGTGAGNGLINAYTSTAVVGQGQRRFQVVRVPQYGSVTLSSGLTALAWNGSTGGILSLDATDIVSLNNSTVSVAGLGFRGGGGRQIAGAGGGGTDYVNNSPNIKHGSKAEGIAGTPRFVFVASSNTVVDTGSEGYPAGSIARGAPGNAGGGGTDSNPAAGENSGGGGGGNGGTGGIGGNTWDSNLVRGGFGGVAFAERAAGRVVLGGGGGAGARENTVTAIASSGAAGGGIVIIRAGLITGTGTINANGAAAYNDTLNDGGGGGGAGGSVVIFSLSGNLTGLTVSAIGGRGGNAWATQAPGPAVTGNRHGPGGGGSGGAIFLSSAPANSIVTGGANGITTTANSQYGAAPGAAGSTTNTVTGTQIPGVVGGAQCPTGPTDVAMVDLKATRYENRVLLEWQTGYEVSNLGFHVYRGSKGDFTKITPDLIAGSALIFGSSVALRAGFAYTWWDNEAPAGEETTYWIEDLDISGSSSIKGPFFVTASSPGDKSAGRKEATATLREIASKASKVGTSVPVERKAAVMKLTAASLAVQAVTSAQQAVKLSVKQEGWYRVGKVELEAAGFSANADSTKLQLRVDGQEVPIQVTTAGTGPVKGAKPAAAAWDGIEFYGIGIDSPYTEAHVYWLTAGTQNGLRIEQSTEQGGAPGPASFQYTVERRDKVAYFAGVKNAGAEKFFGPPIFNAVPVNQPVVLKNLAPAGDATIDISLQGLSEGFHNIRVLLNGTELGTVQFNGREKGTAQYTVPQSSLLDGSNLFQLISPVGFSDLSQVEFVRVTYGHTNRADDNSIRFPATGSQLATIGGFTSGAIRVVDVTNASTPQEVPVAVAPDGAEFAATFTVPGAGARTLLAFATDQKKTPASMVANQASSWRTTANGATYIAVTRKDLIASLTPLVTHRRNQGQKTALVDIEDVYDEFSFGHKSAVALKDFFAYARTSWKIAPRFALLAGDATYDPKNYTGFGDLDIVPTKLVETNFNETATDDWFVDFDGDSVPDIPIGRLPVRTAQETAAMVAKIVRYDRSEPVRRVLMVADRNDGFNFEVADTQSQALIPADHSITSIRRGQLGDAATRTQLLAALNLGAKFVNFYGHGSTRLWTNAQILSTTDAPNLANTDRLALVDSMTCLTGFFHDVAIESLGEALMRAPGGAIAVWASSGMTDPANQILMNQEAIRQLFGVAGLTIGEVTASAKAATGNADVRRTWILLGDPATKLR